jgi:single-strand DNA-binding protein
MNRVLLLGNVGSDPELRVTNSGQSVLKFRLATDESYLDRDKQRRTRTEWHNIVIWGKRAEGLSRHIGKGSRLVIEGSIRTRAYDDRDGNKRTATEIVASDVHFAGGKTDGPRTQRPPSEHEQSKANGYQDDGDDDDIPF